MLNVNLNNSYISKYCDCILLNWQQKSLKKKKYNGNTIDSFMSVCGKIHNLKIPIGAKLWDYTINVIGPFIKLTICILIQICYLIYEITTIYVNQNQ